MEFEKMLKRIEEIVIKLEGGNCGLEEATNLFEEGKNLAVECFKKLDESKGKITMLVNELDGYTEKEFN